MKAVSQHMPEEQKLLVQLAAGGCVRTRRDAEDFCRRIEEKGWRKDLCAVYRAALSLLEDPAAFSGLDEQELALARKCLKRMRKFYVEDKSCKCLRGARREILAASADCPIHKGDALRDPGGHGVSLR